MKRDRIDELKDKNRIEGVIEHCGYSLAGDGRYLQAVEAPGLTVDTKQQRFYCNQGERLTESGDVIEWLQNCYGWGFAQVVRYLEQRAGMSDAERAALAMPVADGDQGADQGADQGEGEEASSAIMPGTTTIYDDYECNGIKTEKRFDGTRTLTGPGFEIEITAQGKICRYTDPRFERAKTMLVDYPDPYIAGGFLEILAYGRPDTSWESVANDIWIEMIRILPSAFVRIVGQPFDDVCTLCGKEYEFGWGEYFYDAREMDDPQGCYCQTCIDRVSRWHRGLLGLRGYCLKQVGKIA